MSVSIANDYLLVFFSASPPSGHIGRVVVAACAFAWWALVVPAALLPAAPFAKVATLLFLWMKQQSPVACGEPCRQRFWQTRPDRKCDCAAVL
jgi:hypothetical protein